MAEGAVEVKYEVVEWVKRRALRWYGRGRMVEERVGKNMYQSNATVIKEGKIEQYRREEMGKE